MTFVLQFPDLQPLSAMFADARFVCRLNAHLSLVISAAAAAVASVSSPHGVDLHPLFDPSHAPRTCCRSGEPAIDARVLDRRGGDELSISSAAMVEMIATEDSTERVAAFVTKRPPKVDR